MFNLVVLGELRRNVVSGINDFFYCIWGVEAGIEVENVEKPTPVATYTFINCIIQVIMPIFLKFVKLVKIYSITSFYKERKC